MKAYRVTGQFFMGHRGWQTFSKEVAAQDDVGARERVLSDLGSRHRMKRTEIKILGVAEVPVEEVDDSAVQYRVRGKG